MGRASDLFYNSMAIDDIAETKISSKKSISYTDNIADVLVTPIYMYQSVPLTTNLGTVTKYIQMIRSEVLDNSSTICGTHSIDNNGVVWGWGLNDDGQVGNNTSTSIIYSSPVTIASSKTFNQIIRTERSLCALDSSGFAWCWGYNYDSGICGINDSTIYRISSPVSVVGGTQFVTGGGPFINTITMLNISGFAWGWGLNAVGQIGDGTILNRSSPVSVMGGINFVAISGSMGIDTNNNVWAWGFSNYGRIGDGTLQNRSSPVAVIGIGSTNNIVKIVSSDATSLMLTSDGYCYACGQGGYVGDNTANNRSSPVSVVGGYKFKQIATNGYSSFGLDDTGQAWAWGTNAHGELGDGTVQNRSSPVQVKQGTRKFAKISSDICSSAIDMDGNIWVWGTVPWTPRGGPGDINCSYPCLLAGSLKGVVNY